MQNRKNLKYPSWLDSLGLLNLEAEFIGILWNCMARIVLWNLMLPKKSTEK